MLRYQSIPSGVSGTADYSTQAFRVAKAYLLPAVEQPITRASEYSASRVPELQTLSCSLFPSKMKLLVITMRALALEGCNIYIYIHI